MDLFNKVGGDRPWEQQFTQEQLNGYFQAQDAANDLPAPLVEIPEDVKDIHVAFENDMIRVGFRYGEGDWSCIISVEFRVWLTKKTNVIALEFCDFRAGALPLGTRTLIDFITEAARRQNIDVTWFRRAGHPIALLQIASKSAAADVHAPPAGGDAGQVHCRQQPDAGADRPGRPAATGRRRSRRNRRRRCRHIEHFPNESNRCHDVTALGHVVAQTAQTANPVAAG